MKCSEIFIFEICREMIFTFKKHNIVISRELFICKYTSTTRPIDILLSALSRHARHSIHLIFIGILVYCDIIRNSYHMHILAVKERQINIQTMWGSASILIAMSAIGSARENSMMMIIKLYFTI